MASSRHRRAHQSTRACRQYSSTRQCTPSAQLRTAQHSTAAAQHNCSDRARPHKSSLLGLLSIHSSPTPAHSTARQTSAQQSLPESMEDQQITQHSHAAQRTAEKCNTFHYVHRAHQSTVFCPHCPTIFWNPSCTCDVYHGFAAGHLPQRELRIKPDGTTQNKYD